MCFGPTASFTASAALTAVGVASLKKARSKKELLFAALPVFFAAQQFIEGVLWLALQRGQARLEHELTFAYFLFAYFFWPIFFPASVYLLEPEKERQRIILPLIFLGIGTSSYLFYFILKDPFRAFAVNCSLHYQTTAHRPYLLIAFYLASTFIPYLLSSYKPVVMLGVINIIFCGIAYYFYHSGFDSVWCYFAAALSIGVYFFIRGLHGKEMPSIA